MYESFYHLSSNPFRLAPDQKFIFSHPSYDEANAYLEYALKLGEGFVVFTGRTGTGKTTLIQTFLGGLEVTQVVAARVAVPNLNAADLLRAVAYAYEIDAEGLDMASVLRRLERFFIQQVRAGKRILLIVDEAQGLSQGALEELRLLADMQTESRFLLQIFLVGQEKLRELMVEPEMEQFQQRVTGTCMLKPLGLQETRDYVEYRLRQVGWSGDPELTGTAVHAVYQYSDGVPRHINKVCTRLLLQGLVENKHALDESDVLEVARDLKDEQLAPLQLKKSALNAVTTGTAAMAETVDPAVAYEELALRAPTETVEKYSSIPVKPDPRVSEERNTRESRVRERHAPIRKPEENSTLWMSTGIHLYLQEKKKILAMTGRVRQLFEPTVVIGSLAGITLFLILLVFYGDNPDGDSNLLASREDAYEAWLQVSKLRDGVYEEYPVYEEPDFVRENRARRSAMTIPQPQPQPQIAVSPVRETEQVPAKYDRLVDVPVPESERVEPVMSVAPIAESTVVEGFSQSASADVGVEAVSVASFEIPVVAGPELEPEPVELNPVQPQPGITRDDEQNTVTDNQEFQVALLPAYVSTGVEETLPTVEAAVVKEVRLEPEHVVVVHSREEEVARLLSLAGESLRENRLMIPADNNAYVYYIQVKALDPDNTAAVTGMDRIAERYILLAEQAIDRDDTKMANRYIERGLHVSAANSNLLALQTAMLPVQPEGNTSIPSQGVRESPVESRTLVSRLKEIFNKNQPEITAPSIWHDEEDTW